MNLNAQSVLRTDISGMPLEWLCFKRAATLLYSGQVAYICGSYLHSLRGGINSRSGVRSRVTVHSILATRGINPKLASDYSPPLNNEALFRRDAGMCMYCGTKHHQHQLSRDHVAPLSLGGKDVWNNVVAACRRCNNLKAGHPPEQVGMELLAVPFTPTHAEYVYLQARNILVDQMEFLRAHFPRGSRLRQVQ